MKLKEVEKKIKEQTELLRTLGVSADEENEMIVMTISKYRNGENFATEKQIKCIESLPNISWRSNNTLRQMNKWCASAIISAAKEYEDTHFFITK